jgi:putative ABC transport system permease protein
MMGKRPGFAVIAVITLALGIGANSAIFTVINAVVLRPLPYPDPDKIVILSENNFSKGWSQFSVAPANFLDWRDQNKACAEISAFRGRSFNLTGRGEPERLTGASVSANLFRLLGATPSIGRTFLDEEDSPGTGNVAVISYGLWQRRFSGTADITGQTINLNGVTHAVIGVMPANFTFPNRADVWTPIAFSDRERGARGAHYINVIARLREGVTLAQARSEMGALAGALAERYPDTNKNWGVNVTPLLEAAVGRIRPMLLVLMAAVFLVLLIAVANVANLMLARASGRAKEIAIRAALGAGRRRLVRQLLTESLTVSLVGGALGLGLAVLGVKALVAINPDQIPRGSGIAVDRWALVFTLGVSIVTGIAFGLAPALWASRPNLNQWLKEGGRTSSSAGRSHFVHAIVPFGGGGRGSLRGVLVLAEIALAVPLMIGAGLLLRSFDRLGQVDPGFNSRGVLTMLVPLPASKYAKPEQQSAFFSQLIERVEAMPGVESAAAVSSLPFSEHDDIEGFMIEGQQYPDAAEVPSANYYRVSPDYFRALGINVISGRSFTARDAAGSPRVAIINETLAKRYYPAVDPVGRRINIGDAPDTWREIVGVVPDVRHYSLDSPMPLQIYDPLWQSPIGFVTLAVRTTGAPLGISAAVRSQVLAVDPEQPVDKIKAMEQYLADSTAQSRMSMTLLGLFAGLALVLASVGLYGVMSFSVQQRRHEIGIRMAMGARASGVLKLVVTQGMAMAIVGAVAGVAAALGLTRLMSGLLYGTSPRDPVIFAAVPLVLLVVALVACTLPAVRATRIDPVVALRYE